MSESSTSTGWETPEFYQSNLQAAEIRLACIPALQKISELLYNPALAGDRDAQAKICSELELENGKLINLGVLQGMESGRQLSDYQKNPLLAAQYLAGQLLQLTGISIPAMMEASQSIGENVANLDRVSIVETADMSPYSREFAVIQQMLLFIKKAFALSELDTAQTVGEPLKDTA